MKRYTTDASLISLEYFFKLINIRKLSPGKAILREDSDETFRQLKNNGIQNIAQLIKVMGTRSKIDAFSERTGMTREILTFLKREAGSYLAKPFPLSDLPGIPYEYTEVLKTKGIRNTRAFFESVQTATHRKELAIQTGIPDARLLEVANLCDLSRITGVGPLYARIIYDSGIHSTAEYVKVSPAIHRKNYNEMVEKHRYTLPALTEDDFIYCIHYARIIIKLNPDQ